MAIDEKVAFYLRHRTLIEEWTALREQAATALEEAFSRAVGIVGQRPDAPEIIKDDADRQKPLYRVSLQIPDMAPGAVWLALGWTHGRLLRPSGESWPYMGIKTRGGGRGDATYDMAKSRLRDAAARRLWTESNSSGTSGWVWWGYLPLGASETDLDAYALRHVEGLVDAWKALESEFAR